MEINLRHLSAIILMSMGLSGCNALLPGMENMHTFGMDQRYPQTKINPTIIPINAALIASLCERPGPYIIEFPDTLNVTIWKHPEFDPPVVDAVNQNTNLFSNQFNYTLNAQGQLFFPLIGYIQASGRTADAVRRELSHKLRTYIRSPQVMVKVAEYRSKKVYVLGEVNKPGLLYLNDQSLSVIDALTLSGSMDLNTGDPRYIYVIRGNPSYPKIYWLNANTPNLLLFGEKFYLQPGDIIYVSTAIVTRWNRFLSQLLPTLQTVWYTKAITGK